MHNIKSNKLQVNDIETKDASVIAIRDLLRYAIGLVPANDYDLVPKWYVDRVSGLNSTLITESSPYWNPLSGGIITITNSAAEFPAKSSSGNVRLRATALVDGNPEMFDLQPVATFDGDLNITAATFYLGRDGTTITKLKAQLY